MENKHTTCQTHCGVTLKPVSYNEASSVHYISRKPDCTSAVELVCANMSLFLALILCSSLLSADNAQAVPFLNSSLTATTTSLVSPEPSPCSDSRHCRSTWDIIWSCLVVIFTCNWVAIHPNIPEPYESTLKITLRRAGIMIVSLIAPEFVIAWALRQRCVAKQYEKEYSTCFLVFLKIIL